jgi:hypothetical protein
MRIAIISDVHNNITNLKKLLAFLRGGKVERIICCGDLASMDTLDYLNDNFSGEIYFVFGNMDDGQMRDFDFGKKYKKTWIFRDYGEADIDGSKIAFVHYPEKADELSRTGKYKFVFYGHTHKPWTEVVNDCTLLNPGNVAGEIYPATFAVWDKKNNKFELIRIHDLNNPVIPSGVEESNN